MCRGRTRLGCDPGGVSDPGLTRSVQEQEQSLRWLPVTTAGLSSDTEEGVSDMDSNFGQTVDHPATTRALLRVASDRTTFMPGAGSYLGFEGKSGSPIKADQPTSAWGADRSTRLGLLHSPPV